MKRSLQEIAEAIEARLRGDGKVEVESVASIGSASKNDLVFVEEEKYLARALQSGAGAVIAGEFAAASSGKPLLISRHPKLTFARAARFLRDGNRDGNNAGVHPTAVIHKSVRLAPGVVIGEYGRHRGGCGNWREHADWRRLLDCARSEDWAGLRDLSEGYDLCGNYAWATA